MIHFEKEWRSHDGLRLFAQGWRPARSRAAICLVHGLGEHSGRYLHVAEAFGRAGYGLLAFDQRGHGRSEGQRGHIPAYEALMDDIGLLLDKAAGCFPDQPRFLYGHSMGGNLVLNYVLRRQPQLAGVIVTAPWLQLVSAPPAMQIQLLRLLNLVWPTLSLNNRLDPLALSHDPTVVQAYRDDPLVHNRISVRMFVNINQAGAWALAQAAGFSLPLLLIHGSADRLTSPEASRQFAAQIGNRCVFKLWEGLFHEPHNEPEQKAVMDFVLNWLSKLC